MTSLDAREAFEAELAAIRNGHPHDDERAKPQADDALLELLIEWDVFWNTDHKAEEWLWKPIIPAGRSTALFAPGGTGKSLISLHIAAQVALSGHHVLYLDYEMTEDDLADRLEDMGHTPDTNLSNLHYALLPSLPGLDQPEGGRAVTRLAELCQAELVIIDTFGRAVHGDENEADTVRDWYRWTGLHLKAAGRAFLRTDHAGKDTTKGQRGTSAKNDDVDVVWELRIVEGGYQMTARKRRMSWIPETVLLTQTADPLAFTVTNQPGLPPGTLEAIKLLDLLAVPVDLGYHKAGALVREAGHKLSNQILKSAVRARREQDHGSQISLDHLIATPLSHPLPPGPESFRSTPPANPDQITSGPASQKPSEIAPDLRTEQIPVQLGPGSESLSGPLGPLHSGPGPEDHNFDGSDGFF